MQLNWNAPEQENGVVFYKIFMEDRNIENEIKIIDDLQELKYLVENKIEPYTEYKFYVEASTKGGSALESNTSRLTVRSDSASMSRIYIFC